jgi:hypothetical protein
MKIIIIIMEHLYKRGTVWWDQQEGERERKDNGSKEDGCTSHIYT